MAAERMCRCELTVPAALLEGYACGRPDCWRTAEVAASFAGFVADVVRDREGQPPSTGTPVSQPE